MLKSIILTESLSRGGFGHLSRCLAISQAFQVSGINTDIIVKKDIDIELSEEFSFFQEYDWIGNFSFFLDRLLSYDIVVIDSYSASLEIYKEISSNHNLPVFIDDDIRMIYPRGVIVNGSIGAKAEWYSHQNDLPKLIGVKYMPLRSEFWEDMGEKDVLPHQIMISLGGQDVKGLTLPVFKRLYNEFPFANFDVVLDSDIFAKSASEFSTFRFTTYKRLKSAEMADLITKSSVCITTGGQTTYEINRFGTKFIAIGIAKNQRKNLLGWRDVGVINDIIWDTDYDMLDRVVEQLKISLSDSSKQVSYVDGRGGFRIAEELKRLIL